MLTLVQCSIQGVPLLGCAEWYEAGIFHGFFGREINVQKNSPDALTRILDAVKAGPIQQLDQVHGTTVIKVSPQQVFRERLQGDAWLLRPGSESNVGIRTADCVPVLMRCGDAAAAAHCGWRGAAAGLASQLVKSLQAESPQSHLEVLIGPCARGCCYEVGSDVACKFHNLEQSLTGKVTAVETRDGQHYLDLQAFLRAELLAAGGCDTEIAVAPACTICQNEYFSYRREGVAAGRQINFISNKSIDLSGILIY